MKTPLFILCVLASVTLAPVVTAEGSITGEVLKTCPLPDKPTIPNGRTSSEAEMLEAQQNMKAYLESGNQVLECLGNLEKNLAAETSEEDRAIVVLYHNKMVEEMESIADLFNQAVRAFKGK